MSIFDRFQRKNFGVVGYKPGQYQLDPDALKTYVPMQLPGDRAWQGYQRWNPVSDMLQNTGGVMQADMVRDPYTTKREKTERIHLTSGGPLNQNSIGPVLADTFTSLFRRAKGVA